MITGTVSRSFGFTGHRVAGCVGLPVMGVWVSESGWPCYIDEQGQVVSDDDSTPPVPGDEGEDVGDAGDDSDVPDTIDPNSIDPEKDL
jgi:hypothetical protein